LTTPEPKNGPKPLINFGNSGDSKLERAFRTLVGPAPNQDYHLAQLKTMLRELGFKVQGGKLSHPMAAGRIVDLPTQVGDDPVAEGFAFLSKKFPETEFHLPYIIAKGRLQARLKAGGKLEPEPEYDEDGFIAD